jgi:hypothetical protein
VKAINRSSNFTETLTRRPTRSGLTPCLSNAKILSVGMNAFRTANKQHSSVKAHADDLSRRAGLCLRGTPIRDLFWHFRGFRPQHSLQSLSPSGESLTRPCGNVQSILTAAYSKSLLNLSYHHSRSALVQALSPTIRSKSIPLLSLFSPLPIPLSLIRIAKKPP